jgi:pantothenate kinase
MSTELTTAATTAPAAMNGSLAAVGTAAKAFVLAHPVSLSIAGGVLLGAGAYWGIQRLIAKPKAEEQPTDTASPAAA